jgi:hypothetical protein
MSVNIFEGARRAGKVFLALVIGIGVITLVFGNGNDRLTVIAITASIAAGAYGAFWAIGWVMRGLLGIPAGRDFKA